MKKDSLNNLNVFVKGLIISIIPPVVIQLEIFFVESYPSDFLVSASYRLILAGILGVIIGWFYLMLKKRYGEILKKIIKGVIIVYYLLFLIYFGVIIFFQTQAPLLS